MAWNTYTQLTNEAQAKLEDQFKVEGNITVNNDIIGDSEDNDLSNKGLRETLEKNWWSSQIFLQNWSSYQRVLKAKCEVTDVLCFKNCLSGS